MCTASWWVGVEETTLCFNRDDRKYRPRAKAPAVVETAGAVCLAPIDPQGGGTWLSVNRFGNSAFVLNNYGEPFQDDKSKPMRRADRQFANSFAASLRDEGVRLTSSRGSLPLLLALLQNILPHFGLLDRAPLNASYARTLLQTDLARTSEVYESWNGPMLVIGAERDPVLSEDAIELYESVRPNAEVVVVEGRRGELLDENVDDVAALYSDFLGDAARQRPVPTRVAGSSFEQLSGVGLNTRLGGTLLGLATFVSEDLACIGGGLLAASGSLPLSVAIAGCLLGIFSSDLGIYFIGRFFGASALRLPILRRLASPQKLCLRWSFLWSRG